MIKTKSNKQFKVVIIVATSRDGVIGIKNEIPWPKLTDDLKSFKKHTLNNICVFGANTFMEIGDPLPKRKNIVLSTRIALREETAETYQKNGLLNICDSIESLIELLDSSNEFNPETETVYICGGSKIYETFMDIADEFIITYVDVEYQNINNTWKQLFPLKRFNDLNLESTIIGTYPQFNVTFTGNNNAEPQKYTIVKYYKK